MNTFAASTAGWTIQREEPGKAEIIGLPPGLPDEFNALTKLDPQAAKALMMTLAAHNVQCDLRNQGVLLRNLREMGIQGPAIARALEICNNDPADLAEKIFAQSTELARQVHEKTGGVTFSRGEVFYQPHELAAPGGKWR